MRKKEGKNSGKRGKFIYRSRSSLLFIPFVTRLKTRATINRNWRNSLRILLADSIGGTILFEIYASLKNWQTKNTSHDVFAGSFNDDARFDSAWYMVHRAEKDHVFFLSRSFPLVKFIRLFSTNPSCTRFFKNHPRYIECTTACMAMYWLLDSDSILTECKNPIIIELLTQKCPDAKNEIESLYISCDLNNLIIYDSYKRCHSSMINETSYECRFNREESFCSIENKMWIAVKSHIASSRSRWR